MRPPDRPDSPTVLVWRRDRFDAWLTYLPNQSGSSVVWSDDECVAVVDGLGFEITDLSEREAIHLNVIEDDESVVGGCTGWSSDERGRVGSGAGGLRIDCDGSPLRSACHCASVRRSCVRGMCFVIAARSNQGGRRSRAIQSSGFTSWTSNVIRCSVIVSWSPLSHDGVASTTRRSAEHSVNLGLVSRPHERPDATLPVVVDHEESLFRRGFDHEGNDLTLRPICRSASIRKPFPRRCHRATTQPGDVTVMSLVQMCPRSDSDGGRGRTSGEPVSRSRSPGTKVREQSSTPAGVPVG